MTKRWINVTTQVQCPQMNQTKHAVSNFDIHRIHIARRCELHHSIMLPWQHHMQPPFKHLPLFHAACYMKAHLFRLLLNCLLFLPNNIPFVLTVVHTKFRTIFVIDIQLPRIPVKHQSKRIEKIKSETFNNM